MKRTLSLLGATALLTTGAGVATAPAASADVWDRVAQCESTSRWGYEGSSGYSGGLQFSQSSWNAAGGRKYAPRASQATPSEQKRVAKNLLKMQGPGAWPVCSKVAGLTRANGGAASTGSVAPRATSSKAFTSQGSTKAAHYYSNQGFTKAEVRKLQRHVGAQVDGVIGPETTRKTEAYYGLAKTGNWTLTGKALKRAQAYVY